MMAGVQHTKGDCMALGIKLNVFLFVYVWLILEKKHKQMH